jgi:hypothetical protein
MRRSGDRVLIDMDECSMSIRVILHLSCVSRVENAEAGKYDEEDDESQPRIAIRHERFSNRMNVTMMIISVYFIIRI